MNIKKPKEQKRCVIKLEFTEYKHGSEATQRESKVNYLGKNDLNVGNLQKNYQESMKKHEISIKKLNKDLIVKNIMYFLKNLIRLH